MGQSPDTAASAEHVVAAPPAPRAGCEALLVILLALIVGLACRGHYAKPYSDFFEFVDVGHALWTGEMPGTLKRGIVYPMIVVGLAKLTPGECPERIVAEWLNVLALALSGVLLLLIGRSRLGAAARWAAAWFVLLPLTAFCTAHLIIEPLLTATLLLVAWLAARGSRWAWALAALAPLVRLDGAVALPAVFVAELIGGARLRAVVARAALAALPVAAWLGLTMLTWPQLSDDHTFARMAAEPTFNVLGPSGAMLSETLAPTLLERLTLGFVPASLNMRVLPWLMTLVGVAALIAGVRRRDRATAVSAVLLVALLAAHSVVPFAVDRYVHPATALLTLVAAFGLAEARCWLAPASAALARQWLVRVFVWSGVLFCGGAILVEHALTDATRAGSTGPFVGRALLLSVVAVAVLWGLPQVAAGERLAAGAGLVFAAALGVEQVGRSAARLGPGDDMKNVVEAARWVRDNVPGDVGVLSEDPGLLRAYAGRSAPGRFVAFGAIAAEDWDGILAECRARGLRYLIWHAHVREQHGGYYGTKFRLDRFSVLDTASAPPGLRVAHRFPRRPDLTIFELAPTSRESAPEH